MPVVSDYTAILYGQSWNGADVTGHPVILTFSFSAAAPSYYANYASSLPAAFVESFTPFSAEEQVTARAALAAWADSSGIIFIEVPDGLGDLRFGKYEFDLHPTNSGAAGFAYYPSTVLAAEFGSESPLSGDVFIDDDITANPSILLHEIGHALGFKHSFSGDITLAPELDNRTHTVMSYTGTTNVLGDLDLGAVDYVYGAQSADGSHIDTWSWDSIALTLTQAGADGADIIRGVWARDAISGGLGDDWLFGFEADDVLEGGAGADTLDGGPGTDGVIYRSSAQGVTILLNWTAAGGEAEGDIIRRVENVVGSAFADSLTGDALANQLDGGAGADLLDGGAGSDRLIGRNGDDLFYVDSVGDVTIEALNDGLDTVVASRSWAVASNIEKVILSGAGDFNVAGNGLANNLKGNSGDNWLNGSFGKDTLTGGGGRDSFIFNRTLGANNVDTITDYDVVRDVIRIDNAVFAGIGPAGALAAGAFNTGASATQADDRIIYDQATGKLFFDIDGLGGSAQIHFATLSTKPTGMSAAEFIII